MDQASTTGRSCTDAPANESTPSHDHHCIPQSARVLSRGPCPEGPCPGGRVTFVMQNPDASDQAMTPACGQWPDLERRSKVPDGSTFRTIISRSKICLDRLAGAGSSPSEGLSHGQCKMPAMYCISHHLVSSGTTSTRTSTIRLTLW